MGRRALYIVLKNLLKKYQRKKKAKRLWWRFVQSLGRCIVKSCWVASQFPPVLVDSYERGPLKGVDVSMRDHVNSKSDGRVVYLKQISQCVDEVSLRQMVT